MKESLLISTMCYQLFDELSTDEAYLTQRMQFLRDCGIQALDYSFDGWVDTDFKKGEINDFWNKSLDELYAHFTPLKNAAEKTGLVFSQTHAIFPLHFTKYPEATEYLQMSVEKNIAIAAFLGCPPSWCTPGSTVPIRSMSAKSTSPCTAGLCPMPSSTA